jgi:formylglycine-generating enzyme required for sulfatase activity
LGLIAALLLGGCSSDNVANPPADSTPPAATVLRVDAVTDSSLVLSWRAPGDNGMFGIAGRYDLRYSTAPFDLDTWSEATPATGLPSPSPSGSLERYTLTGLDGSTTYYLAVRSADSEGNWSEPSAVTNLTVPATSDHPVLWLGGMLPGAGTSATGFIYRVRLRLDLGETPTDVPSVVVDGVAHTMRRVPNDDLVSAHYEFSSLLEPGSHDYYFTITDQEGNTTRLPDPGSWPGPDVTAVDWYIPDFVAVDVDTFLMGNSNPFSPLEERPQHEVILTNPMYLDRYECTNTQFCDMLNWALDHEVVRVESDTLAVATPSGMVVAFTAPRRAVVPHGISYAAETGFTPYPGREDWPANFVTWYGAAFYCNVRSWWDGLPPAYDLISWRIGQFGNPYPAEGWRLPTEAEWEYAAQYNDGRLYPFGNHTPRPGVDGNFGGVLSHPSPVGSYPRGANELGVRDLAGNVWEWCHDWYDFYAAGAQTDPWGPRNGINRILRGGSWGSPSDELTRVRRFSARPGNGLSGVGFRCARRMP